MQRILYVVDDQPQVLEVAVLILRTADPQWKVVGFKDPQQALEAVKSTPPDLMLSDQVMPGLSGSELLDKVSALSPATIRILMSGHVALSKLTLITSAHQYLAKPFDPTALRSIIRQSFAAQARIVNPGLQKVVTGLRSIPSLPLVHQSLLRELEDSRTAGTVIANLVADDPGLSLKVLHLANSPLFCAGCEVTNPVDAVMRLGTDMIAAVVLSQSLFRHYESLQLPEMDLQRVWVHCWETARLAQHICREQGLSAKTGEEAFLAGLVHEIGRFILIDNFPDQFKAACDQARRAGRPFAASLRETFQATSSEVAAYILELWGLPNAAITAIGALDDPQRDSAQGMTISAALYIADQIASAKFPPDSFSIEGWNMDYLNSVGCADQIPVWEKLFSQTPGEAVAN
jgi:HD-like signal output (HDOD) protein